MTDEDRLKLKLVAGLLGYPGLAAFSRRLRSRTPLAQALDARLGAVCRAFRQLGMLELEKTYVASFDFDAKGSLYVTAHEMGDSRDRGQALIELAELYRGAGYEVPDDQLPDYLPMLLELAALRPEALAPRHIERIAAVSRQIALHLGRDHAYQPLFEVLGDALGARGGAAAPHVDENPDLTNLPYPVEYR